MKFNIVRPFVALFCFTLCTGHVAAQDTDGHGSAALRIYYNDLNKTLSSYELNNVPFEREQVIAAPGDTLLDIAKQNRFRELDFYHLAAALYEINSQALDSDDESQLKIGATINLPTVEELFVAQDRYEKLRFVGEELDFNNQENQMRKALRWPFGKSLVMIGPYAKDELPRNQEVTLTSYRPDTMSINGNAAGDFLSSASTASTEEQVISGIGGQQEISSWLDQVDLVPTAEAISQEEAAGQDSVALNDSVKIYGGWFAESEQSIPIVESIPLEDTNQPHGVSLSDGLKTYSSWLDQTETAQPLVESVSLDDINTEDPLLSSEPLKMAADLAADDATESVTVIEAPAVARADVQVKRLPEPQVESAEASQVEPVSETVALFAAQAEDKVGAEEIAVTQIEPVVEAAINEDVLKKQPLSPPIKTTEPLQDSVMAVVAAAKPALTRDTKLTALVPEKNFYLGAPRDSSGSASNDTPSDPLSYIVEWDFDESVSVGTALGKLASYIGYELVSEDELVLGTYTRQLPRVQLRVGGVSAEDGFAILAGRGLETVFDHVARSVKHVPRNDRPSKRVIDTAAASETHKKYMLQTGISAMLKQFPNDMQNAARRHARRCDSSANTVTANAERLHNSVVGNLQKKATEAAALNLVEWYKSPTGRKVLELERGDIDDEKLQKFTADASRANRIQEIYNHTVTGKGIASIAVELDYAGWILSGCTQKAEQSGDVKTVNDELIYGQRIKNKFIKLESILREDMLRSMDYLFSSMTDAELTEYTGITRQHAGLHAQLQQSIVKAIELETQELM